MPGSDHKLIVTGMVETVGGNLQPKLIEASPQGINPQTLLLNLSIVDTGNIGTKDINYRDARFEKPASSGQYTNVEVFFEGDSCFGIEVTEAH
jgi:hypothetical protein